MTLQLAASYLRSIRAGRLVATGRVVQKGRTAGHAEAEVVDLDGRLVARFSSTCLVLREEAPRAWAS